MTLIDKHLWCLFQIPSTFPMHLYIIFLAGSTEIRPLTFIRLSPHCINVLEGDSFQLTCAAIGDPPPTILWSKDRGHEFKTVPMTEIVVNRSQTSNGGNYR